MDGINTFEPTIVSSKENVSSIINKLERFGYPVVVTHGKKYFGLIDLRIIQENINQDPSKTKTGTMARKAPRLIVGDSLEEVVKKFYSCRYKALPVVDEKNEVISMITLKDTLKTLISAKSLPNQKVLEIMTSPVSTLPIDANVGQTVAIMRARGVRRLAVVDQANHLKGLLSVEDMAECAKIPKDRNVMTSPQKYSFKTLPISDLMKKNVETTKPTSTLKEASLKMADKGISSLIVVDKDKPVGIVALRDILSVFLASKEDQKIHISGLTGFDKNSYQDVYDLASEYYEKLDKRFSIKSLSLHIKKNGNRYTVFARAMFSKKILTVSNYSWDLTESVYKTLNDLLTSVLRMKPIKKDIIKKKKTKK
ncbi:CBS domain-containing protein [Candidatus Micrarchaeota archaeon]|nr:CBS domain-containing protein [Candidatus Micrarchaeota archaeon]